jgi:transcriptional regulator with XRE-family HTH domain
MPIQIAQLDGFAIAFPGGNAINSDPRRRDPRARAVSAGARAMSSTFSRPTPRPRRANPAGDLLRGWRMRRAISQADLAFEAGISARHLSYVETGKAACSRATLLQLATALDLSLRDRNALLEAGGFARQYGERDLSAPELADARRAIDLLLRRHEPFPAIVTDRRWNVVDANGAARRVIAHFLGAERLERPLNHMRLFLAPDELRPFVEDWPRLAGALMMRARHEAMAAPLDAPLQATWRELGRLPDLPTAVVTGDDAPGPLCEIRLRSPTFPIGLIGAVLTLGTPQDVTLQELRVEIFMPADAASEAALTALAANVPDPRPG